MYLALPIMDSISQECRNNKSIMYNRYLEPEYPFIGGSTTSWPISNTDRGPRGVVVGTLFLY